MQTVETFSFATVDELVYFVLKDYLGEFKAGGTVIRSDDFIIMLCQYIYDQVLINGVDSTQSITIGKVKDDNGRTTIAPIIRYATLASGSSNGIQCLMQRYISKKLLYLKDEALSKTALTAKNGLHRWHGSISSNELGSNNTLSSLDMMWFIGTVISHNNEVAINGNVSEPLESQYKNFVNRFLEVVPDESLTMKIYRECTSGFLSSKYIDCAAMIALTQMANKEQMLRGVIIDSSDSDIHFKTLDIKNFTDASCSCYPDTKDALMALREESEKQCAPEPVNNVVQFIKKDRIN